MFLCGLVCDAERSDMHVFLSGCAFRKKYSSRWADVCPEVTGSGSWIWASLHGYFLRRRIRSYIPSKFHTPRFLNVVFLLKMKLKPTQTFPCAQIGYVYQIDIKHLMCSLDYFATFVKNKYFNAGKEFHKHSFCKTFIRWTKREWWMKYLKNSLDHVQGSFSQSWHEMKPRMTVINKNKTI